MEPTQIYWPGTEILRTDDLPAGTTVDLVNVVSERYNSQQAYYYMLLANELINRYSQYGLAVPNIPTILGDLSYDELLTKFDALGPASNPNDKLRNAIIWYAADDELYDELPDHVPSYGRLLPFRIGAPNMVEPGILQIFNSSSPFFNMGGYFDTNFVSWFRDEFGSASWPYDLVSINAGILVYALAKYNVVLVADDSVWGNAPITNRQRIDSIGGENTVAYYYAHFGIDYWATKQARADAWIADPNVNLYDITVQYDLVINLPKILPTQDDDGQLGSGGSGTGGGTGGGETGDGKDEESTMWPVALLLAVLFLGGKKSYRA
jgi:hypothetical protein